MPLSAGQYITLHLLSPLTTILFREHILKMNGHHLSCVKRFIPKLVTLEWAIYATWSNKCLYREVRSKLQILATPIISLRDLATPKSFSTHYISSITRNRSTECILWWYHQVHKFYLLVAIMCVGHGIDSKIVKIPLIEKYWMELNLLVYWVNRACTHSSLNFRWVYSKVINCTLLRKKTHGCKS